MDAMNRIKHPAKSEAAGFANTLLAENDVLKKRVGELESLLRDLHLYCFGGGCGECPARAECDDPANKGCVFRRHIERRMRQAGIEVEK
jgi:hypothetical protein